MFVCYICGDKLSTPSSLIVHFNLQHMIALNNRYKCRQENCVSDFQDPKAFKKHLLKKHQSKENPNKVTKRNPNTNKDILPILEPINEEVEYNELIPTPNIAVRPLELKNIVKSSAANLFAKLNNHNSLPRSVVQDITEYFTNFNQTGHLHILKERILNILDSGSITEQDKTDVEIMFDVCENIFEGLDTDYKRLEYF